jgi:hypothetical protein
MASTRILGLTHRAARIVLALAIVMLVAGTAVTVEAARRADATTTYPVVVEVTQTNNLTCTEIGQLLVDAGVLPELPNWTGSTKVDPPSEATDVGAAGLTISNLSNSEDGVSFDWTTQIPIDVVYVKSGVGASRVYVYDPATGATSGAGLTTGDGKQISHIDICWGLHEPTPTTSAPPTSEPPPSVAPTSEVPPIEPPPIEPPPTASPSAAGVEGDQAQVLGVTQDTGDLPATGTFVGLPLLAAGLLMGLGAAVALAGHLRRGDAV